MARAPARNAVEEAADELENTNNLPVTRSANALTANLAEVDPDELGDGVTGMEFLKQNDFLVPRLGIIEGLSPQLLKSKVEYIEGAQKGDFVDTGLGEIFRGALHVIPCTALTTFLEWPAKRGGAKGPIKDHGMDRSILDQTELRETDNGAMVNVFRDRGTICMETMQFYVLNVTAGGRPSYIPMSGTRLKWGRRWNSQIAALKALNNGRIVTPAMYANSWIATPKIMNNEKGEWFVWSFEPGPRTKELDPSLLVMAREFAKQVQGGLVKPDLDMDAEPVSREEAPM